MGVDEAPAAAAPRRRYLFVTGQLAKEALERTLRSAPGGFDWRLEALRIKVAALLTTDYLKATLPRPGEDAVYLPGLCQADLQDLERSFGVPFRKGPKDLREIPEFFGGRADAYRWHAAQMADRGARPAAPFPHRGPHRA